jgi:hypothetical protein
MSDDHPNEPGPLPPQAVDVPFLITASELWDRKNKRRTEARRSTRTLQRLPLLVEIGLKTKGK